MFTQHCPRCGSSRLQLGFNDAPLPLRLIGVNELLCNNCHLEFKGLALFGKLRRSESTTQEVINNRRRAPRFNVKVPVTAAVVIKESITGGTKYSATIQGYTLDLSKIGLAVVLPESRAGEHDLTDPNNWLWLKLELPTGTVAMRAAPVRHEKLGKKNGDRGWVIGVHIRKIDEQDAGRFYNYLDTLG